MKKSKNTVKQSDSQQTNICPICGKEFNENSMYMISGKLICSWKCFFNEVNKRKALKEEANNKKQK